LLPFSSREGAVGLYYNSVMRVGQKQLAEIEARKPFRPYEQIADLIGSVPDLPTDLSERTGERFALLIDAGPLGGRPRTASPHRSRAGDA
jgi:hypothetical protein